MHQITVRAGKGDKDRITMLPAVIKDALAKHVERVKQQHQFDLEHGAGWVELPWALARKYPNAGREWAWQWIFPATRIYVAGPLASAAATICTSPSCSVNDTGRKTAVQIDLKSQARLWEDFYRPCSGRAARV